MKHIIPSITALLFLTWTTISVVGCNKIAGLHECKFDLCPFKGAAITDYHKRCDCVEGSDCYKLDSVHIVYPNESYDENEEHLTPKHL